MDKFLAALDEHVDFIAHETIFTVICVWTVFFVAVLKSL